MSIESAYDEPRWEGYLAALSSFARLIRFDPRGIGLSDPLGTSGVTIEQYANDTLAVMKTAESKEAALLASGKSGPVAIYLAATQPNLVRALVLINTYARVVRADDYPHGIPLDWYNSFVESLVDPTPVAAAEERPMTFRSWHPVGWETLPSRAGGAKRGTGEQARRRP